MISNRIQRAWLQGCGAKAERRVPHASRLVGQEVLDMPDLSILAKQPGQFAVHCVNAEAMTKVHHGTSASDGRHL